MGGISAHGLRRWGRTMRWHDPSLHHGDLDRPCQFARQGGSHEIWSKVMTKTIVITGASSGFGALSARALADAGHVVYAGMRDIDGHNATQAAEAKQYAAGHDVDLRPLELDVSSQRSVDEAVGHVISEQGSIDVLLQHAGHMATGPTAALPLRAAPYARPAARAGHLDREHKHARRNPSLPRALLRCEGGHGRSRRQLRR